MIFFEGHWQTRVHLEEDYWVCEGSGNNVTWRAFGRNKNIYPREGWLGKYCGFILWFEGLLIWKNK